MGLIKKYMNQTRKPEGFLGNLMITGMNTGHAAMAKVGITGRTFKRLEQAQRYTI